MVLFIVEVLLKHIEMSKSLKGTPLQTALCKLFGFQNNQERGRKQ